MFPTKEVLLPVLTQGVVRVQMSPKRVTAQMDLSSFQYLLERFFIYCRDLSVKDSISKPPAD